MGGMVVLLWVMVEEKGERCHPTTMILRVVLLICLVLHASLAPPLCRLSPLPQSLCRIFLTMVAWFDVHWTHLVDTTRAMGDLDRWSTQLETWYEAIKGITGQLDEGYFGKICTFVRTFEKKECIDHVLCIRCCYYACEWCVQVY